jgi:hypothetical protein
LWVEWCDRRLGELRASLAARQLQHAPSSPLPRPVATHAILSKECGMLVVSKAELVLGEQAAHPRTMRGAVKRGRCMLSTRTVTAERCALLINCQLHSPALGAGPAVQCTAKAAQEPAQIGALAPPAKLEGQQSNLLLVLKLMRRRALVHRWRHCALTTRVATPAIVRASAAHPVCGAGSSLQLSNVSSSTMVVVAESRVAKGSRAALCHCQLERAAVLAAAEIETVKLAQWA